MLPFVALSIWLRRKDSRAEIMTGRIAMREGLKFTIAATLLLCIFQIVFFYQGFHDYKCDYIRNAGPKILSDQIDHGHLALKKSDIPKMIEADIQGVTPFREITSVVFKNVLFGAFASFLFSLLFKRRATK